MKLRGIEFGTAIGASGVQGFFGEGYWFHKLWKPFGLDFKRITFVAKTTTLEARKGNMPLGPNFMPRELFPKCIVVKPFKRVVLNSVGLSGPGAKALLEDGRWQQRREPFFISFMSVEQSPARRTEEARLFARLLQDYLRGFQAPIGLQVNFSCPNIGLRSDELAGEVERVLLVMSILDIPLVPKFNALLPVGAAKRIAKHPWCDALCISNTIPWGELSESIDWEELFDSTVSPLAHLGGGGLSGAPLLPIVQGWVYRAREAGIEKPIIAGGGILSLNDADEMLRAGASSVSLGSIAILRPWRVRRVITELNSI